MDVQTAHIGFIGLGTMGGRVCANLLAAGCHVTGFDPQEAALARFSNNALFNAAASVAELARVSDVIFLSLPDSPQVLEIALSEQNIKSNARNGLVVVDMSTVDPATPQRIAAELEPAGITWLDAPVSGGPAGAEKGTLTIMVGGRREAFDQVRPLLEIVGSQLEYMGGSGLGATTKIVNQLACGIEMIAMFEAFTVGAAAGIDPTRLWEVLRTSTSRCWIMEDLIPSVVLPGRFDNVRFALRLEHKDLRIAAETAQRLRVPSAGIALANQVYAYAEGLGWGDEDHMAPIKLYGAASGVDWERAAGAVEAAGTRD